MLRGFDQAHINLSKPSNLKERQINLVTPELNKFYMDSDAALLRYIETVSDVIEARKAFGVTEKGKGIGAADDTIGHYVSRLREQGKIRPDQENILRDIYQARFNQKGTRGFVGLYKNVSYIDTMGSPISAITQIGDMAWALYKNGPIETGKALWDATIRKSAIKKEDLGIERIAQEFSDSTKSARAVDWVFRHTGLNLIDNIGKEALVNSTLAKARKMAKDPKQAPALMKELKTTFGAETGALVRDLQTGRITENVKLHLFNTLCDFQPVALSEMPAMYLKSGNGRLFYMLKSYTLKMFDVYRRECFQKIKTPGTRLEGIKNLAKLSACLVMANATADVIKGVILGRDMDFESITEDNIARLFGVSKFAVWTARREGIGTAIGKQILPPFKFADSLYKDITRAGDGKGLETVQSAPMFGKLYYWWFGKGSQKKK
jgi:hypothetical protein